MNISKRTMVGLLAVMLGGCGGSPCDSLVVDVGAQYVLQLGQPTTAPAHVPTSGVSCGTLDGIAEGDALDITITSRTSTMPTCYYLANGIAIDGATFVSSAAPREAPPNAEWLAQSGHADFGDGCTGVWELGVSPLTPDIFEPSPGTPNAIAVRYFIPDNAAACAARIGVTTGPRRCDDVWEAHLVR